MELFKELTVRQNLDMSVRSEYPTSEVSSHRPYYKLFVGCISYDASEEDLLPIFSSFGEIMEFTIQRDREGRSRGCAWLKYSSHDACENCIATLSNKYYVNGMRSAIVVKYANAQDDEVSSQPSVVPVSKLFVGGFLTTMSDDEIHRCLSMFGDISDFNRLTRNGIPTGPVFVTYIDRTSALALLNANGATIFSTDDSGSSVPITLRVSGAFSPVRHQSTPSVASQGSSESPMNARSSRPPSVLYHPTSPGGNSASGAKLFVGCLPYSRSSMDLSEVFSRYGPLLEVALLTTPEGKSKGAAFVTFVNREDADTALNELQGYCFPNSSRGINISFATKQTRPTAIPTNHHHAQKHSSSPSHYTPSSSSTDPMTPPGFSAPPSVVIQGGGGSLSLFDPSTSYDSDDLIKFLAGHASSHGDGSPFSILPGHTEELTPSADVLDTINHDLLSSIFGETLNRQKGV